MNDDLALVLDLAAEAAELRAHLQAFRRQIDGHDAYLGPKDDDELRAEWLRYWRLRQVLSQFCDEHFLASQASSRQDLRAFFIAFAAVLVLVDLARSIREYFS